jgi:hypothetical protein
MPMLLQLGVESHQWRDVAPAAQHTEFEVQAQGDLFR